MDAIAEVTTRKGLRAWVQFEQRTVEDKKQSEKQGKYIGKDVEFVIITPPYGKDNVHQEVTDWLDDMTMKVRTGRMEEEERRYYVNRYELWKKGLTAPEEGTPIMGWGCISPAQQKLLVSVGIATVESLADVNDEGIRAIGMGAVDLKRKAAAWVSQLQDKGPLTQKMAAVEKENDNLKTEMATMRKQLSEMQALLKTKEEFAPTTPIGITASDLVDEEPTNRKKR